MNILLTVARFNLGGAESYTCSLALELQKRGMHVAVLSGGGNLVRVLKQHGIRHYFFPIKLSVPLAGRYMAGIIRKEHIDIVHGNAFKASLAAAYACRLTGIPYVISCHGMISEKEFRQVEDAAKFLAVSRDLAANEHRYGKIPEEKLLTVYNGIDLQRFYPAPRERHTPFRVGIVSRLRTIDYKGHGPIMRAMAKEPSSERDWVLCVAGNGPAYWPMRFYAWKLKISKRVRFLSKVSDIPKFLRSIDMLVLGTTYETFGLALAEAMAAGLPVAAVAIGGMKEVVGEDGSCGFLVPVNDRERLVRAIENCKNDPDLAAKMGRAGLERVRRNFSISSMTDRILECYKEVLQK